jgi:hypothetical protein
MSKPVPLSERSNRQLADEARRLSALQRDRWEDAADYHALKQECERRGLELHWDPQERKLTVPRVTVEEF